MIDKDLVNGAGFLFPSMWKPDTHPTRGDRGKPRCHDFLGAVRRRKKLLLLGGVSGYINDAGTRTATDLQARDRLRRAKIHGHPSAERYGRSGAAMAVYHPFRTG